MSKRKIFYRLSGISLVTTFILASCNIAATAVTPVSMTATQVTSSNSIVPTATLPAAPAATDTPVATATAAPTATTAPIATSAPTATAQLTAQVIPSINAYCRKGPGTGYYEITFLQQGTAYNVIGRNSLNTWWLILAPGNVKCWMGDPNASEQGPVEQALIVMVPPLPVTPSTFVDSYKCNTTLHTLDVVFNWAAAANVTGYRIYRNGSQLTDVGPNVTAYSDDNAPRGVNLVYELEAHNDFGAAARISVTVPACD